VVHGHFDDAEAGVLDLAHHLQADDARVALQLHAVEDLAAQQAEVAVDVAHAQPEEELDDVVIGPTDDDAVQRIRSADLVAIHHVGVIGQTLPQRFELCRVVLRIAVGVSDQRFRGGRESGSQGATVPAISLVMDDANLRVRACQFVGDSAGRVAAPVVDDDHLEVRGQAARHLNGADDETGDGPRVVVRGKENAQPGGALAGGRFHLRRH
jgi:hypothetical protein